MKSEEIVRRTIEFECPPRLPLWQNSDPELPDDVFCSREMDRGKNGWFFDNAVVDDWGCGWEVTETKNMGQVVTHPLQNWSKLDSYRPPNPRNPFYFSRLDNDFAKAGDRYVVVTSHFNLFERLYMLHGFNETLMDLCMEPDKTRRLIAMILEFKLAHFRELHKRFGSRVNALFLTDDWGTQEATFISRDMFREFFLEPYKIMAGTIHELGYQMILHSCGKINDFMPLFIEAGIDALNIMQPRCYGIGEIGRLGAGKIAFVTSADIQKTLPSGDPEKVKEEVKLLLEHWNTSKGGLVAFNSGEADVLGVNPTIMSSTMMRAFVEYS